MGTILKMVKCGGDGGKPRDMNTDGVTRISKVLVRHWDALDAILVMYEFDGYSRCTRLWGGNGGRLTEINLEPNEYFTCIHGYYGKYWGMLVIRSLTFVSNLGTYGPYGKQEGVPFSLSSATGKIIGFHARSGRLVNAIGIYVKLP